MSRVTIVSHKPKYISLARSVDASARDRGKRRRSSREEEFRKEEWERERRVIGGEFGGGESRDFLSLTVEASARTGDSSVFQEWKNGNGQHEQPTERQGLAVAATGGLSGVPAQQVHQARHGVQVRPSAS